MIPETLVDLCKKRMEPYNCEGFVYGKGPSTPEIMIVGEAPGETEIHNGMPFSGRAGKVLDEFFNYIGVSREDIYFTSTVRSRPYKIVYKKSNNNETIIKKYNRAPTMKEQLAHAPILDFELQHIKPKQLVTLGNIGLQRLVGKDYSISDVHGEVIHSKVRKLKDMDSTEWIVSDETYSIFPTFHPASIFYNRSLEKEIYKDLDKLKNLLEPMKKS